LNEKFPPTQLFPHEDIGLHADKAKPNLLANATITHINTYIGTEIDGVQISQLSNEGLAELALYAAERKLLLFRNQDFKDISPEKQIELVR
jgi:sulfonate dioxygenase